jgi:hypothetical protein
VLLKKRNVEVAFSSVLKSLVVAFNRISYCVKSMKVIFIDLGQRQKLCHFKSH